MKTLYLHQIELILPERIDAFLNASETELTKQLVESEIDDFDDYDDLRIRDLEKLTIEGVTFYEILYSYVTSIQALNPETEEIEYHSDLRYGFIWINWDANWIAIAAKDVDISTGLITFFEHYLDTIVKRINIPKEVINQVEGWEGIRRTSHEDDRGIRRRISGSKLGVFPDEITQLRDRDQKQRRTSSGYNVQLEDGTDFVLGYNGDKGSFYFSKNLKTSQLRQFGVKKILDLFAALDDCWVQLPEVMIKLTVDGNVNGTNEQKACISELISGLAMLRLHPNISHIDLNIDVMKIANIDRYFDFDTLVDCTQCGDSENIRCPNCDATSFKPTPNGKIKCKTCKNDLTAQVSCLQDHTLQLAGYSDVVSLYPKPNLYYVVEDVLKRHNQIPFNHHEEGFFLRGSTLHITGKPGNKTVYMLHDIPEFAKAASIQLTPLQNQEILNLFTVKKGAYQEKCSKINTDNCARCVDNRVGSHCFMRLFGLYDTSYTPRPHQGHEFGDVSLSVTLNGISNQAMIILLKKGNPNGNPITKHSTIGGEIFTQFDDFVDNPTVHIIAIGVPQRIEDGFKERLRHKAVLSGKKILFIGVTTQPTFRWWSEQSQFSLSDEIQNESRSDPIKTFDSE